jgi:hypothetical protein
MHSSTSALEGGGWSASRTSRLTPGKRTPGTHWVGGWVGPRAGLDTVSDTRTPIPARNRTPIVQPVAIPTELPLIVIAFSGRDHKCIQSFGWEDKGVDGWVIYQCGSSENEAEVLT